MRSHSAAPSNPVNVKARTVFKYAARVALGAIVLYTMLGNHNAIPGVPQRHKGKVPSSFSHGSRDGNFMPTYWSSPPSPEATVTPDHVEKANIPSSPEPEELVSSDSNVAATAPPTSYAEPSDTTGSKPEGEEVRETILDENENIDAFLKNLFEEDGIPLPDDLKNPVVPAVQTPLSEEEKSEIERLKVIETKEKRTDITKRHTQWEKKLARTGEEELLDLIEKVKVMRKAVVDSMRTTPDMFSLLKSMQEDGFKQVENTEKFLQKLKKDRKIDEEISSKWTKIVAKVQERLDARTIETTTYLQKWYKDVMQKEKAVFEASADMIDKLADEAQADIGMDYAWLDDVSTDDWTRYHQLKGEAKRWIREFEGVYNATHVEMTENIVVTELIQVEAAMMRVAADLNQALDQVRMIGARWLQGEPETVTVGIPSEANEPAETEEAVPSPVGNIQEKTTIPVPETSTPATQKHQEL